MVQAAKQAGAAALDRPSSPLSRSAQGCILAIASRQRCRCWRSERLPTQRPILYPTQYPGHELEALHRAKLPVRAAVDRSIRSATGVHCSACGPRRITATALSGTTAVSPGWPAEPGWLDMEPNNANRSRQHHARDPSSASTPTPTGQVRAADLSALARALVAAAVAVHGRPPGGQMVAGRSGVAGSGRWRFHPSGQLDRNNEDGCDRG
jgi:hypothetical protein